jgi:hypothetical protein
MNDDSSPIQSWNINMGKEHSSESTARSKQESWNVLICSDFGFVSDVPERIWAGAFKEFLETKHCTISGVVDDGLPSDIPAFYAELDIRAIDDFRKESLVESIEPFQPYFEMISVLEQYHSEKITKEQTEETINALRLPELIRSKALELVGTPIASVKQDQPNEPGSTLDSILAVVDLGTSQSEKTSSGNQNTSQMASVSTIPAFIRSIKKGLDEAVENLMQQPFFVSKWGSWIGLHRLLKTIGRNREVSVYVFSSGSPDASTRIADALRECVAEGPGIDCILWDYPYSFTTADMEDLEQVSVVADQYKSMLIGWIEQDDEAVKQIIGGAIPSTVFDDSRYIPFHRLRNKESTRSVVMCLPALQFDAHRMKGPVAGSCWAYMEEWITSIIENSNPFVLLSHDSFEGGSIINETTVLGNTSESTAKEVSEWGLSLCLGDKNGSPLFITASTLLGLEGVDGAYSYFGYNLLVNRSVRLATQWIGQSTEKNSDKKIEMFHQFLRFQLESYHILSTESALKITNNQKNMLTIDVNSNTTIGGYPVRFQFSVTI